MTRKKENKKRRRPVSNTAKSPSEQPVSEGSSGSSSVQENNDKSLSEQPKRYSGFQKGWAGGPGRGKTKELMRLAEIRAAKGKPEDKSLPDESIFEQMMEALQAYGPGRFFLDMLKKSPTTFAQLAPTWERLAGKGLHVDKERPVVFETRFPGVHAVKSDFDIYAVVEENERLKKLLARAEERAGKAEKAASSAKVAKVAKTTKVAKPAKREKKEGEAPSPDQPKQYEWEDL